MSNEQNYRKDYEEFMISIKDVTKVLYANEKALDYYKKILSDNYPGVFFVDMPDNTVHAVLPSMIDGRVQFKPIRIYKRSKTPIYVGTAFIAVSVITLPVAQLLWQGKFEVPNTIVIVATLLAIAASSAIMAKGIQLLFPYAWNTDKGGES